MIIAERLNSLIGQGGFCIFRPDGSGGGWYDNTLYPPLKFGAFIYPVPRRPTEPWEIEEQLTERFQGLHL